MPIPMTDLALAMVGSIAQLAFAAAFVFGGIRFRRWVVEDRPGIPRFPNHVETVLLWLIYSVVVAVAIVVAKQTLRHF